MGSGNTQKTLTPSFPIYVIGSERAPIVASRASRKFVMGFSNRELAELVATRLAAQKSTSIGILAYRDHRSFVDLIAQLVTKGVTHMSWDLTGASKTGCFVDLKRLVRD